MQNIWKEKLLLIRLLNKDNCVEWAGTAAYLDAVHVSEHGAGDYRLLQG